MNSHLSVYAFISYKIDNDRKLTIIRNFKIDQKHIKVSFENRIGIKTKVISSTASDENISLKCS